MLTRAPTSPLWRWVGDRGLICEPAGASLTELNASARALAERVRVLGLEEVEDVVPGAASVLVLLRAGHEPSSALLDAVSSIGSSSARAEARLHEIEVAYGGVDGPDLPEVARLRGVSEREIVAGHSTPIYTVGFLGFSPGFAYLIGLPEALATPRLATPRTRVPAGSVAIGGLFTGIYPRATPGGWRLVGRTSVSLFDPAVDPPARFAAGDRVRLVPK